MPAIAGTSILTAQQLDAAAKVAATFMAPELNFVNKLDDYSSMFKDARTGRTEKIRKSAFGSVRSGYAMSSNAIKEESVDLTIGTPLGYDLEFYDDEIELDIGSPQIMERLIRPGVQVLGAAIEADVLNAILPGIAQAKNGASFGVNDLYDQKALLDWKVKSGTRYALLGPDAQAAVLKDTKALNVGSIDGQYKDGVLGNISGFNILSSVMQNAYTTTTGRTNTTINGAQNTEGLTAITVATTTGIPAVGEVFTIAGVYDYNQITKTALPRLKQFVCKAGTTATSLVVDAVYFTGNRKNVSTSTLANGIAVTFVGAAASNVNQSLFFAPGLAGVAFVDLKPKGGAEKSSVQKIPGMNASIRLTQDFETRSGINLIRMDVQLGKALINPELGSRFLTVA